MASQPLISWNAPEHYYVEKHPDWYWAVGIITLAIAAITFMFGNVISGIFVLVAATTLVIHASRPPRRIQFEINDRGVVAGDVLYPFLTLESFCIPHDEHPAKIIIKSRKPLMPFIIIYIDEVDPEEVREVLLTYITETQHRESILKHMLEKLGF